MKRLVTIAAIAWALASPALAAPWPEVALPPQARPFDMGGEMNVNGTPLRMHGFVADVAPAVLAGWFREHMGGHVVQNTVERKIVLGQPRNGYYVSVQLEPAGRGTRGLVAVTHLKAGYEQYPAMRAALARLLDRLPAGTRIVSRMTSTDGDRQSTYLVAANGHPVQLNRDRLAALLRADGLALQREIPGADGGSTLFFQGRGSEATAVVTRGRDGQTSIALQTLYTMERLQ